MQRTSVGDVEIAYESFGTPGDTPLLLVMGAVLLVLKRKRGAAKPAPASAPKKSLLAGLKSRFKRTPKAAKQPAAPASTEPVLEG